MANKVLAADFQLECAKTLEEKMQMSFDFMQHNGSMFTCALYVNLACLIWNVPNLQDKTILLYSYGSGSIGCVYYLKCVKNMKTNNPLQYQISERDIDEWVRNY
jgi:3-hydroxy-3-methylglutaryl CoA synthase